MDADAKKQPSDENAMSVITSSWPCRAPSGLEGWFRLSTSGRHSRSDGWLEPAAVTRISKFLALFVSDFFFRIQGGEGGGDHPAIATTLPPPSCRIVQRGTGLSSPPFKICQSCTHPSLASLLPSTISSGSFAVRPGELVARIEEETQHIESTRPAQTQTVR